MSVCLCACVVWVGERDRDRDRQTDRQTGRQAENISVCGRAYANLRLWMSSLGIRFFIFIHDKWNDKSDECMNGSKCMQAWFKYVANSLCLCLSVSVCLSAS